MSAHREGRKWRTTKETFLCTLGHKAAFGTMNLDCHVIKINQEFALCNHYPTMTLVFKFLIGQLSKNQIMKTENSLS